MKKNDVIITLRDLIADRFLAAGPSAQLFKILNWLQGVDVFDWQDPEHIAPIIGEAVLGVNKDGSSLMTLLDHQNDWRCTQTGALIDAPYRWAEIYTPGGAG